MRIFFLAFITASAMLAQTHAYLFVAPGVASGNNNSSGLIHLGGGGEYVLPMRVGVGAEVGFLGRTNLDMLGTVSLNGYYHFQRNGSWEPFVTGGYSNFFTFNAHRNLANLGGGVNYWYKDHLGIKLEFLDHFSTGNGGGNFAEFRFGFNFK
jgi:hypothetical protein